MLVRLVFLSAFTLFLTLPILAAERPLSKELPLNGSACWERVYDDAHLKAHPKQKVTAIRLAYESSDVGPMSVSLLFKLRKATSTDPFDYEIFGFCRGSRGGLACGPEWDAGTWRIERGPKETLLIRNGGLTVNPVNYSAEDISSEAASITAEPDDRIWRLLKISDPNCGLP